MLLWADLLVRCITVQIVLLNVLAGAGTNRVLA